MRRVAVLLAAVALLAGCGTDAEDGAVRGADASGSSSAEPSGSPSASPSSSPVEETPAAEEPTESEPAAPADAPACAAVWRDGTRLARDYDGCMAGGAFVAVDQEPCSFGQRLVRYGGHFYAVRGGPVNRTDAPLAKDRTYRGALASCRA